MQRWNHLRVPGVSATAGRHIFGRMPKSRAAKPFAQVTVKIWPKPENRVLEVSSTQGSDKGNIFFFQFLIQAPGELNPLLANDLKNSAYNFCSPEAEKN